MRRDAGRDGAVPEDPLAFGPQTQRYIRAQKTRSKNRRCFTVLHHRTRPLPAGFSLTQFRIPTDKTKTELSLAAGVKIYSRKLASRSDNSAVNFNACRQVFCFSNICSKVTKSTHPSFPEAASNRRYPAAFCAHPVSSIPDNSEFHKTGKNRSCSDCS